MERCAAHKKHSRVTQRPPCFESNACGAFQQCRSRVDTRARGARARFVPSASHDLYMTRQRFTVRRLATSACCARLAAVAVRDGLQAMLPRSALAKATFSAVLEQRARAKTSALTWLFGTASMARPLNADSRSV